MDRRAATSFVIGQLVKGGSRNEIIRTLCEETNTSWQEAERFVDEVEFEQHNKIEIRQAPLLVIIGISTVIAGLLLTASIIILTLGGSIYFLPGVPVPYLGNLVYLGSGLAMLLGGSWGTLQAIWKALT